MYRNITVLSIFFSSILLCSSVFAQTQPDLNIICENTAVSDNNCKVYTTKQPGTQNKNAPLFNENDFPNRDLKPGDSFTKIIEVTNNRPETCFFELVSGTITDDTQVLPGRYFSQELEVTINDGVNTYGPVSFYDLFNGQQLPVLLTSLEKQGDTGYIKDINWNVSFDKDAGNEYQLAKMKFNFDWNFQCGAPTLNTNRTSHTGGAGGTQGSNNNDNNSNPSPFGQILGVTQAQGDGGIQVGETNPPAESGENNTEPGNNTGDNGQQGQVKGVSTSMGFPKINNNHSSLWWLIFLLLLIGTFLGYVYKRKRK